jgi:hypothetical protein
MAASTLPRPGTENGPCEEPCEHRDCALTRRMANTDCAICHIRIGYDRRFYQKDYGLVHFYCAAQEATS